MTVNLVRKKKEKPLTFKGHYAGFVSRLVAFVIDILVVTVTIAVILGTINLVLRFFNINLLEMMEGYAEVNSLVSLIFIFMTGFGFTFVLNLLYTTIFWILTGKTIGKAIMGLRVIGPKGSRVTVGRALRRYIGYWISAIPLFLGYFWVLINDSRHGWHDIIAGTGVIYDHEAQYSEDLGRLATYAPRIEAKMEKQKSLPAGIPSEEIEEFKES